MNVNLKKSLLILALTFCKKNIKRHCFRKWNIFFSDLQLVDKRGCFFSRLCVCKQFNWIQLTDLTGVFVSYDYYDLFSSFFKTLRKRRQSWFFRQLLCSWKRRLGLFQEKEFFFSKMENSDYRDSWEIKLQSEKRLANWISK